jgi:P27 family predicted phage terminase small subunit
MPGPPPIPVERKRLLGNPGRRRLPDVSKTDVILSDGDVPKAPRKLTRSGMRVWSRLWTFGRAWISPNTDIERALRYVEALEDRARFRQNIKEQGDFVIGSKGQDVLNPMYDQLNATDRLIVRLESMLGLTPADRSRIGVAEVKVATSLDRLAMERERRREERERMRAEYRNDEGANDGSTLD